MAGSETGGTGMRSAVPPRESATALREGADRHLWTPIDASDRRAIVGLKSPKATRGAWQGDILLDDADHERARDDIASVAGVEVLAQSESLPAMLVRLASRDALAALRSRDRVDYIDAANVPGVWGSADPAASGGNAQSVGCTGINRPWGGFVYGGPVDRLPGGDVLPLNYKYSHIEGAWLRGATGAGITVGVLDTGVFRSQLQLLTAEQIDCGRFNRGDSRHDRSVQHLYTYGTHPWDKCNHGTRMASNIAAPRDGQGLVGVAWNANLISVKVGDDVVADGIEQFSVGQGIALAADRGAKIIAMAFGAPGPTYASQFIADQIAKYHARDVLFVGAAGTTVCYPGGLFPAKLPIVVAATGLGRLGFLHADACGGPEVDVGAVIEYACASGRYLDAPITFGGSSAATALVAGVAALIWSTDPSMSRDAVVDRLYSSCSRYPRRHPQVGYGLIDAFKAVGGKSKEKEKDKEKDKDDDKLAAKEHDKFGPKEHDAVGAPPDLAGSELLQRLADVEQRLDVLEHGEQGDGRPFIRPEERPTVGGS